MLQVSTSAAGDDIAVLAQGENPSENRYQNILQFYNLFIMNISYFIIICSKYFPIKIKTHIKTNCQTEATYIFKQCQNSKKKRKREKKKANT